MQQINNTDDVHAKLSKQFPHNEQLACHFTTDERKKQNNYVISKEKEAMDYTRQQINEGRLRVVK